MNNADRLTIEMKRLWAHSTGDSIEHLIHAVGMQLDRIEARVAAMEKIAHVPVPVLSLLQIDERIAQAIRDAKDAA